MSKRAWVFFLFSFALLSCSPYVGPIVGGGPSPILSEDLEIPSPNRPTPLPLLGNSVLYWNQVFIDAVRLQKLPPTQVSATGAILHISIFEAVNSITVPRPRYQRYNPPNGRYVPVIPNGPVFPDAAINGAAFQVLGDLIPDQRGFFQKALVDCPFNELPNGGRTASFEYGTAVALSVLRSRPLSNAIPPVRPFPGVRFTYRVTPDNPKPPLEPFWGNLPFFALPDRNRNQYLELAPPPLNSRPFLNAVREVEIRGARLNSNRTPYETQTAQFWADDPGTMTPPGHWNLIAQNLIVRDRLDVLESARVFALVNMALGDAGILCWWMKFGYAFWRPIDSVAEVLGLPRFGLPGSWAPLLITPNFPEYPSGHSTFSAAAASVLDTLFADNPSFTTSSDRFPGVLRKYPSARAASEEAGYSRILGGIHYMFSNLAGREAGTNVGVTVVNEQLLPR